MAQELLLEHTMSRSRSRFALKTNSLRTGLSFERTLDALLPVATAQTHGATFEAMARAREVLGEDADPLWPLVESIAQRQSELEQLRRLAGTDDLTGVCNRRTFNDTLNRELARRERTGVELTVIVVDMDDLKWRNDVQGHAAGDEALRALAECCRTEVRSTDMVARLGGDEFGILLIGSDRDGAELFAQRLREQIEGRVVRGRALRVSMGSATAEAALTGPDELLDAADASMYRDKCQRKGEGSRTLAPPPEVHGV